MVRAKSDSGKSQSERINRLKVKITSPIKLKKRELQVFDEIVASLPGELWDEYRLRLASHLARMTVQNEDLLTGLIKEGYRVINLKGTPVANPLVTSLNQTTNTIQTLAKTLGLSASQRGISATDAKPLKEAEKLAKNAINNASNSGGLLA